MRDEPHAKPFPTRWQARMCSEGVFRCVSDDMGQWINAMGRGPQQTREERAL